MTESDEKKLIPFRIERGGNVTNMNVNELTVERVDQFAEEYNHGNRSAALRHLVCIGLQANYLNDPRVASSTSTENDSSESIKLKDFVPVGRENAVDVRDELIERIDNELLEAVQDDPEIEMEGWEVYRDEG